MCIECVLFKYEALTNKEMKMKRIGHQIYKVHESMNLYITKDEVNLWSIRVAKDNDICRMDYIYSGYPTKKEVVSVLYTLDREFLINNGLEVSKIQEYSK